jgi:hypothetical protein
MHRILRYGSRGPDVQEWQQFLDAQQRHVEVDGVYGGATRDATERFQGRLGLSPDGVVGPATWRAAERIGLSVGEEAPSTRPEGSWPPPPAFAPLVTSEQRSALFGRFEWIPTPTPQNPEAIRILDGWAAESIAPVEVTQLRGVEVGGGGRCGGRVPFHRLAAEPLRRLWRAWQEANLLDRVITFDGAYVPRLIRGSTTVLSAHAFGTAFDINARWNAIGRPPAPLTSRGSVIDLVELANQHGFYWGGHFSRRLDGMHFELARVQ